MQTHRMILCYLLSIPLSHLLPFIIEIIKTSYPWAAIALAKVESASSTKQNGNKSPPI